MGILDGLEKGLDIANKAAPFIQAGQSMYHGHQAEKARRAAAARRADAVTKVIVVFLVIILAGGVGTGGYFLVTRVFMHKPPAVARESAESVETAPKNAEPKAAAEPETAAKETQKEEAAPDDAKPAKAKKQGIFHKIGAFFAGIAGAVKHFFMNIGGFFKGFFGKKG